MTWQRRISWHVAWIVLARVDNNDPEPPRILTNEKKTVDLCGHQRDTARCVRVRGHEGPHEAFLFDRVDPVHWE